MALTVMGSLYRLGSLAPSLADKAREAALAEILGRLWGCAIVHLGEWSRVDWQVLQNGVEIGCAEVKFRGKPFRHYPDGMLPLDKLEALLAYERENLAPAMVINKWTDKLVWCWAREIDPRTAAYCGGTRDTPNGPIQKKSVLIPNDLVREITLTEEDHETLARLSGAGDC
jgi:hypothetical protein